MKEIVKLTSGYVAVDMVSFVQEAVNKCVNRVLGKGNGEENKLEKDLKVEDFLVSSKDVVPVLKREGFAKIPTTKLSDIGAL